jgi:cellulose synthase/poly-beta-1,6-N-acetylglucosamine synthase-like glycosyltransferase
MFLSIFSGTYLAYFAYVRNHAKKPWNLIIDRNFQPEISILIPVHNEELSIASKLRNVKDVSYPKEKIEVIVADDASKDKTLIKVKDFMEDNAELIIKVVRQNSRAGKSAALNKALAISTNSIVIVSDADTYWPPDVLQKALPYLSNPRVGAVTGSGVNRNTDESWVTKAEDTYLHFASLLRLGESKVHSTIRFEGGFCAYKKDAFERFDCETGADDSGTALEVVQRNYRAIMMPDAVFYTQFPTRLIGKLRIKARRANQLISLWVKSFKLLLKKRLLLPKRIAVPEIMLFIFNPIILLTLIITGVTTVVLFPFSLFSLAILLFIAGLLIFAGRIFFEVLLDNLILLYALTAFVLGRRYIMWEKT